MQSQVSPSPKVAHIVGNLCNDFPHTISDPNIEVEHIRVLRMLWHSVQRAFSRSQLLKEPSDKLLTAVVKRGYQISNMAVQAEWLKLCRDIVCSASSNEELAGGSIFDSRTWVAVARTWAAIDDVSADSLVTFLKFVFPCVFFLTCIHFDTQRPSIAVNNSPLKMRLASGGGFYTRHCLSLGPEIAQMTYG